MNGESMPRSWQVLLIGGPSGAGKTSVSYRIAQHFGVGITEVDDFQVILEHMTTPTEQPALHYWRTHPDAIHDSAEQMVAQLIAVGQAMTPALELVIANHLESRTPLVLEGDFILPALLVSSAASGERASAGSVRALIVCEDDEEQLRQNFLQREPEKGLQAKRAHVSWRYGQWLHAEAERVGAIALPARPWHTLFARILTAIA